MISSSVLGTSQTAECGDDRSDRDGLGNGGLGNGRRGTASLTDGRVTAERAGVGTAAGLHSTTGKDDSPGSPTTTNLEQRDTTSQDSTVEVPKRGRGRPRGSLNKKTIEAHAMQNHRPSDASGDSGVTDSGRGWSGRT